MNSEGWPPVMTKILCYVVGHSFSTDKDENFSIFLANLLQMLDEFVALLKLAANINDLLDIMVRSELHGADIDLNKITQKILQR